MKRQLLRGAAAAALSAFMAVSAQAQDGWSGFYIGGHIGGGEADYDGAFLNDRPDLGLDPDELDLVGVAGGAHAGYNYLTDTQLGGMGILLLGVEGDVTFTDWKDSIDAPSNLTTSGIRGDVDLLASVRGRLGVVASNDLLVYITGGVAFSDASFKGFYSGSSDRFGLGDVGGVVGGGFEYALNEMVRLRIEALYYIFDDEHSPNQPPGTGGDYTRFDGAYVARAGISIPLGSLMGGTP